jgi:DinB family protein
MPGSDDIAGIKSKLNAERAKLLESFRGLTPEAMMRPFEVGWSIKDILAHIAMAEGVNVKFAKLMTAKETPVQLDELAGEYPDYPMPFELDKFNAWMTGRWRKKSLIEVIDSLHTTRAETLAWLDTLMPAQLDRVGAHALWGSQSVRGMFKILLIHDKFHRGDIEKRKK